MGSGPDLERLAGRATEIAKREWDAFFDRTTGSARLYERARQVLPLGVASSFQTMDPYPMYVSHGSGSHIWDVDGNEYLDYHNGFGVTLVGHAHPAVVAAIDRAARNGTHFAAMSEVAVDLAAELCQRFRLDRVRFSNTGTEATMEAIRVARAATGRSILVKVEGGYHGHHDAVMWSVGPSEAELASRPSAAGDVPHSFPPVPFSTGMPADLQRNIAVVPYNDAARLQQVFEASGPDIAAFIIEPVMMFAGIVLPDPGYLERVRELCTQHGVVLIFDEVKTGANIAAGGATELFGVTPDLACFAKAIGGGVPIGAFGGTSAVMEIIEKGEAHLGTFNGNPLAMSAGLAALTEVLTPDGYAHLREVSSRLADGCRAILAETSIPAHVVDLLAKGGVCYRPEPLHDYRDAFDCDPDLLAASSPWLMNRGIFQIPADKGQWMLSVQHSIDDIERYLAVFADYCGELVA